MAVINTNTKALFSQLALKGSGRVMSKAMEQLSTGKRINTGGDDAAGLAISTRMTQQIRSLNQAVRNAGDAVALIQTTEGATNEITNMLQRMRELAIQAINDTNSNEDRSYLDLEFQQLKQEIDRVAGTTEWNGFKVLDGTAGERVGEMPVYKSTSVALSGDLLINPTTLRTVSGTDAGEQQTVRFLADMEDTVIRAVEIQDVAFTAPSPAIGAGASKSFTLDGVSVTLTDADTTPAAVGAKVASAFNNSYWVGERQEITLTAPTTAGVISIGGVEVSTGVEERQTIAFDASALTTAGTITVGGVSVELDGDETDAEVAVKVKDALEDNTTFSARLGPAGIAHDGNGTLTIEYIVSEGDVQPTSFADTDTTGLVAVVTDDDTEHVLYTAAELAEEAKDALEAAQSSGVAFLNANVTRDGAVLVVEFPASDGDIDDVGIDLGTTGVTATVETTRQFGDRQVVVNEDGTVTFTFSAADSDAAALAFVDTGTTGIIETVTEVAQGIPETTETFTTGSRFIQAGALTLDLAGTAADGEVTATFTTADGEEIELTGVLQKANGTVTFSDALGDNAQVLTGAVTYTFTDGTTALSLATGAGNGLPLRLSLEIDDTPQTGLIRVGGIDIQIRQNDAENSTSFASRVKAELERSSIFASGTGRTITQVGNELTLTYASTDGDVDDIEIVPGGTGVEPDIAEIRTAVALADETISAGGEFKQSGSLSLRVNASGVVTATFLTNAGESIRLTAELDASNGQVVFRETDTSGRPVGLNSQVISGNVTYTLMDSASNSLDISGRAVDLSIDIEGGIPAMRAGDLQINGVEIGASYPADDTLSPRNNAAGSAIAKAAAINRKAGAMGSTVGESQSITFAGVPKTGQLTVAGVTVLISENDNTVAKVASKVASALRMHPDFDIGTGRTVSHASGSAVIHLDFPPSERDVPKTAILPGTTNLSAVVDVTREYATSIPGTGVYAKVNENVVLGREMSANSVARGVVFVNGFASADITTTLNNTRESRATVVNAINAITYKTGVKAIDTGSDLQGVTLVAADGRNIEVRFETSANSDLFGQRVGLREGVQASTISLESKVDAPIILSSGSAGDISRVGLVEGNFSRNESVVNTAPRDAVLSPVAQTESVRISGDATVDDVFYLTINGQTFSHTVIAGATSAQDVRDGLLTAVTDVQASLLGVELSAGYSVGELVITSSLPGNPYTLSISSSSDATATIQARTIQANQASLARPLGMDDLVINGVKIRPSAAADDTKSSLVSLSSDRAASAVAIAATINHHSSETGVRALANAVTSKGAQTSTLVPDTGTYLLYINGTEVDVPFVKAETPAARRESVVAAINERTGQHGVTASDNGRGVTLTSDGRNLSVWFDGNIENLSAASFGLEKGGSVAQVSRISVAGTVGTETATVELNGVSITSAAAASSAADLASKLAAAIRTAITADESLTSRQLANLEVSYTAGDDFVEIISKVAGTEFDLRGASVSGAGPTLNLATVTENSLGLNDISVVRGANEETLTAKTLYGTVRMISDPKLLPEIPSPLGSPPSDQLSKINATGKPIDIRVGDKGFSDSGNFVGLGFQQGFFGGRASEALDPPRVGRMAFQVGASANQLITIDLADFGKEGAITSSITGDVDLYVEDRTNRIHTRDGATAVLEKLDDVMDKINATRAQMGAVMNRLQYAMDNLSNVSMNQEASRSQIQDADYAKASTELAKSQIMQQAATAVLAQANMSQQTVLQLLQG